MFARNQRLQKLVGGGLIERTYINVFSRVQMFFLKAHKDKEMVRTIKRVRRERQTLLTAYESFIIYALAKAHRHRPGHMAEVGVYQGGSARLICEVKGDTPLHLFDTFEGLPQAAHQDGKVHKTTQYTCTLESVREYLRGFPHVYFYQGLFPESAAEAPDVKYSFVHFDVDLYESTKACLEYFYPRMLPAGVMVSHDYSLLAGVKQAFHEFLADKPEEVIELPSTQCMVIKQ